MESKQLYSIGQFAKLCDVSVKQLRYLEEKGVLLPMEHGAGNKYRYYGKSQLEPLVFIKTLRDLGIPFRDIVSILENPEIETSVHVLQKHLEGINSQVQQLLSNSKQCMAFLTHMLKGQHLIHAYQGRQRSLDGVSLIDIPPQTVFYTRYHTHLDACDLFLDRLIELKRECLAHHITPSESMHAIFHSGYSKQFTNGFGDLETFFPVADELSYLAQVRRVNGFQGVSCKHVGHYKHIGQCYQSMEDWAGLQGYELMSLSMEIYLLGPDITTNPDQYITQVIIPVKGSRL